MPGTGVGYAYHVPYRAILPRREQCGNLLVPVALSSTHVAMSSLRIEGAWMAIGQAAGVAASLASKRGLDVQDLPYAELRTRLLAQGQSLELPPPPKALSAPPGGQSVAVGSLKGIVLDDATAELRGEWSHSTNFRPHVAKGYLHDDARGDGRSVATFSFTPEHDGRHAVRMAYSAHPTRARNVPVRIIQGTRTVEFLVDQTKPLPAGGAFRTVGEVELKAGEAVTVEVSNRGTQGFVIMDALQFLAR